MSRDRYGYCSDPYRHEDEGRDAARWGERYDWDHRERMDNARYGSPDSCDAAYARGYEREVERREELRREERAMEEAEERRAYERRMYERQMEEEAYYAQIPQYPEPPEPEPPQPPPPSEN